MVQAPAQRAGDGLRLVGDLLAQVGGEPAPRVVLLGDLDRLGLLGGRAAVERRGAKALDGDRGQLAVVEVGDLLGVAHERGDVGGDEHLVVADPDHDGRAVAGDDQLVGRGGVADREAVGADDPAQRGAHAVLELRLVGARDQVGEHLGVGVRDQLHAVGDELGPQLVGVLEDAVVDDRDAALGVDVGVGVDVARRPVGGPARVGDADRPVDALGQAGGHVAHTTLGLVHAQRAVLDHGHAGRVIAAVLEPLQPLHQDRHAVAPADVSDDPAHACSSVFSRR